MKRNMYTPGVTTVSVNPDSLPVLEVTSRTISPEDLLAQFETGASMTGVPSPAYPSDSPNGVQFAPYLDNIGHQIHYMDGQVRAAAELETTQSAAPVAAYEDEVEETIETRTASASSVVSAPGQSPVVSHTTSTEE